MADKRPPWMIPMYESYVTPKPPAKPVVESGEDEEWSPTYNESDERDEDEIDELIERSERRGGGGDIRGTCTGAVNDNRPVNYGRGPHDNEFGMDDKDDRQYGLDGEEFELVDPDEDEFADHR